MPRSNIPLRSMRYFSNRKHNSVARSHIKRSSGAQPADDQEGQACPVNNILVLPKNSETTINVISSNNRSCSHGNLFKKIKGRKRREKQRLKKRHNFEDDVKPVITKVNSMDSERMKPRLNKHIIFLSDSDDENDMVDQKKPDASSSLADTGNCEEDDDVIFVETPAAEIIEIDDGTEQNESLEDVHNTLDKSNDQENSLDTNDFLDNADINLKSKFNFELHGSEFKGAEFLKPSVPVDVSESGSHSSISDVSASIGMNVFNVCDFPQEKDNLFDDNNLEKFRKSITPQRPSRKSRNNSKDDTLEYRRKTNDTLPILSDIQEETNNRKQRGRSIIKELVNHRAHVLLSTAQKKLKNKKRKSKDELSDTLEEENVSDSQELMKRKKKKKLKKQDNISEDINSEITNSSFGVNTEDDGKNKKQKESNEDGVSEVSTNLDTDLFESSELHISKKSKKSKRQHSDAIVEEERKKKKSKKAIEETSDDGARKSEVEKSQNLPEECHDERKRKKNKKASEINIEHGCAKKDLQLLDVSIQEKNEEKKKKKSKKNIFIEVSKEVAKENLEILVNENESLINRKNKGKQQCNESISQNDDTQEKNCTEGSTSSHNKELNEIVEKSEGVLNTTEDIVNAGEKNSIKDQVLPSETISVDTDEKKVMIENMETCKIVFSETLKIDQFSNQIPEFKNTQELQVSIVESESNEKSNILQDDEKYISEKGEKNYGGTPVVSFANIGKEIQNDSHNLEIGLQENSGDQKKKKTKRISEISVESFEPKRIKLTNEKITNSVDEISHPQNDEIIIDNVKKNQIDELLTINDITEEKKSLEILPNLENESSQNKIVDKALEGHNETECIQNRSKNMEEKEGVRDNIEKNTLEENNSLGGMEVCISDESKKADNFHFEDPMVVVDSEGNVDMKIVKVFSTGTKSIFPEENNFTDDVEIDNFLDNRVASWTPHPSKFSSYNESLFNDGNRRDKIIEDPIEEIVAEEPMTTNGSLNEDLQPSQTSALECAVSTITLQNNVETATVQEEKNDRNENCSVAITPDENLKQDILVKVEEESNDKVELAVETNSNVTLQNTKKSSTFNENSDSESFNEELPNEIEEIFKEKENHNTVRRLCEFLEEVNDPNDVLKKVSLLKQAFTNKVQHMVRMKEVVKTSNDDDDDDDEVLSISSSTSSVMCLEDSVSVVSIDDDITLANCDLPDDAKNEKSTDNISAILHDTNNVLKENDEIQSYQNQSISNSTLKSGGNTQKGLDKYEVEDIQETMSDDPKLWKIFIEDVNPPKLPTKGKRCIKCKEIGHLGYNCPNRLNLPNCALCGMEGHLDFRCPNRICIQCGRKAPVLQNFCDHCKHYKNLTCTICKNKGHPKIKCPDFWRRYHLTVNHGPLVQREALKLKEKKNLWCSSCARCGHLEYECKTSSRKIKNYQSFDPRVHQYEDIYKIEKKTSNLESVHPNLEEVPQITQLIPNNDGSSSSNSSTSASSENLDGNQNTSVVSSSNAEDLNQSIDSTAEGLNTLPPEFEVIDEVNDETQGIVESIANPENYTLFMTGSVGSLKHFLSTELTFLETFKFDIRNIQFRFFTFQEDNKRLKCRFPISRKRQFYKELNMLLFGKLQVKCGRVHTDKLKHFVNHTVDSLTIQTRESLYYSYDYIFRDKLHDHVNYQFFMKMLRQNYGFQRWLH
ncbi:MATH and LRR domain-containing protein PFE0570w-like [Harmonia axyridis]|uniref:MATH and LRR domain-containing protein PFE0570w-like n=1 Tax=Harmonia axyridis TaxID=115357 RepID=UPI001E2793D1|nr:MATH and LRR domain-containing protein PFE0570w-like [Harmonia axyridis]XP_045461913.1 MATH and LRR domain-containing protein PFE0570w-like [Harmonia axyridis]XP_045461914.1 MATH and LRR domain-containing protein PFE0570w-like [Harmonia axyridis]